MSQSPVLPGLKPVMELLASDPARVAKIFIKDTLAENTAARAAALCRKAGIPMVMATAARLDEICQSAGRLSHQGLVAQLRPMEPMRLGELLQRAQQSRLPLILALDQVQDPGNAGALCRTAWAMGCAGLITTKHNSAPLGPAAARSSAGTLALMPVCQVVNLARALDEAEEADFTIYGAACREAGSKSAFDLAWKLPAILVLGSENSGIRPGVSKRCHAMLHIPQLRSFDSLNVAQAGGILAALCARSRLEQLS